VNRLAFVKLQMRTPICLICDANSFSCLGDRLRIFRGPDPDTVVYIDVMAGMVGLVVHAKPLVRGCNRFSRRLRSHLAIIVLNVILSVMGYPPG
jgi:hypothetical protein